MTVAERLQIVQLARISEDVDRHDGLRPLGHGSLDRHGIDVQRAGVDVREHRRRALVDRAVGGRHERVGRRDHLVAGRDRGGDAQEVQAGGAARHRHRVRRADRRGELLLEAVDRRPERQPPGAQHVEDELLLPLVEPGERERDDPRGRGHERAGAISTTSSQWLQRSLRPFTVSR